MSFVVFLSNFFKLYFKLFLIIVAPPQWIKEPRNVFTQEGESLEIHCQASGVPEPTIKWIQGTYFYIFF